jgi:NADPH:quinone reductase-like Zn-dependent oxidoreductase
MNVYLVKKGSSGISSLARAERERPSPGPNQVLVRMRAASLNFRDLAIVRGKYFRGPVVSDTIPLSDGAGEVAAVGSDVDGVAVGDRVVATFTQGQPPAALGLPLDGVLSEYVLFEPSGLLKIPDALSFSEAATLPCAGVTAWNALYGGHPLAPGETVVTLGTGGVSIFALQLAKLGGARVIITSSSDEKLERARALGADHTINYVRNPAWENEVLNLTGGQGADKVVDLGGAGTLPHSYQAVGPGGEVLVIGVMTRPQGDLSPYPLMRKAATLRGVFVGGREYFERLLKAILGNDLCPVIDKTFGFDTVPQAYEYLKSAQHLGKIVIKI